MSLTHFDFEAPPTVLVVDDRPVLADLLRSFLSKQGMVALPAYSTQQCLEKAEQGAVDVIVVGLVMSGIDGLEVCAALKETSLTRSIPVVLLTDRNDMATRLAAMKLGVSELVLRPIRVQDLLARIQIHLEWSCKVREMDRVLTQEMLRGNYDFLPKLRQSEDKRERDGKRM